MENNEDSILPSTSSEQEDTSQKGSVVDMMLGKSDEKVIDSETMIQETQKRIWSSLKKGIEYDATVDRSDAYLRKHVHEKQSMVVMYVDLVGSTDITLTLPEEKVAIIIGMIMFGMIDQITGSMRNSVLVFAVFFIAGVILLLRVPKFQD